MVLEVDEAGVLEAVEDGVGGLLLGARVAGEEGSEVDELLPWVWLLATAQHALGSVGYRYD